MNKNKIINYFPSTGSYFAKQAREDVIKQNGCLVVPISKEYNLINKIKKENIIMKSRADEILKEQKVDVKTIIKELVDTDFGGSNEDQGKGIQLLKGLAFSDAPEANAFMEKLNDAYTKIGNEVLKG
jgi:predicted ATP-dependent protease